MIEIEHTMIFETENYKINNPMSIIQSTVDVRNNDYNKHTIATKKTKKNCKGIVYVTAF